MTTVSYYNLDTGFFTGRVSVVPDMAALSIPQGLGVVEGRYKRMSFRVDLNTGAVVPREPTAGEIRQKEAESALRELAALDARSQRYTAESAAGILDDEGRRRLLEILARKVELRMRLNNG
jgi:hypothetical protein